MVSLLLYLYTPTSGGIRTCLLFFSYGPHFLQCSAYWVPRKVLLALTLMAQSWILRKCDKDLDDCRKAEEERVPLAFPFSPQKRKGTLVPDRSLA